MATEINTVSGKVTGVNGLPLANLKVAIYNVDMREWLLLNETTTNKAGAWETQWASKQLGDRERKSADLAVKVFTGEKGTELFASSLEEVRFNAGEREEINITLKQPVPAEVVEFDFLVREVTVLAGKVPIVRLQEDAAHRDITFLSKELEVPPAKLEHLVVAHRLQELSKVEASFFYALLRKDRLLQNNFSKGQNARLSIGIDDDNEMLLYDMALLDPRVMEADIKAAIDDKIVSYTIEKQLRQNVEILSRLREKAEGYYKNEHPKKVVALLSGIVNSKNLTHLQPFFQDSPKDFSSLSDVVAAPSFLFSAEADPKMKEALGKFFGLGSSLIPDLIKDKKITRPEDIRRLARLNKADWVGEITRLKTTTGDKKTVNTLASAVVRNFEKEFPTVAFAAQLQREDKALFRNQEKMVSFFQKHEDFDLQKNNVDLYLAEKKVSQKDTEAIGEELKSVQRVFKLVPNYSQVNALRNEKIHSAQSIVSMGRTRFTKEIAPKAGLSEGEARDVYQKAEAKSTAAFLLAGDLQDSRSVINIASFETKSLALKLETVSKDFPNLKSLFEGTDSCACAHCRSVYSPAAYLVEILQFLDKRSVVAGNAKSVLFGRRPDLGETDLSCANANTPVKYIDLVCELLEEAVAPDKGIKYTGKLSQGTDSLTGKISEDLLKALLLKAFPVTQNAIIYYTESTLTSSDLLPHYLRDENVVCRIENTGGDSYKIYRLRQTLASAEALDAAPEYVNAAAYKALQNKAYAFALPFSLTQVEAEAYFNRFDVKRAHLMQVFQSGGTPATGTIAGEQLGLAPAEQELIIAAPAPNDETAQQAFWNVPAGKVFDYMKRADQFLDKTGISYTNLERLLALPFISGKKKLFIKHLDLSCDTAQKEIEGLDADVLDRIHRFLRLQRKTGWKFEVLDAVIAQPNLGGGQLNEACLVIAAQLKEIGALTGLKTEELTGCFGEISHTVVAPNAAVPLYQSIFLNKAKNGVVNEDFLPENVDGSKALTDYRSYLSNCLQLNPADLELLLSLLPNNKLEFSNLSFLFFASRLLKKLKLKAPDFAALMRLSGRSISGSPQQALDFIALSEDFKNSPLKVTDVAYLLQHEAANLSSRELLAEKAGQILDKLAAGYLQIAAQNSSRFDADLTAAEQTETLIATLSAMENLNEDGVKTITGFLEKNWVSAADAKGFIDATLDKEIARIAINGALDALDAAAGTNTSAEQLGLLKALLDAIALFEVQKAKRILLVQTLVGEFKADPETVAQVLKYAVLKQQAPGTALVAAVLEQDLTAPVSEADAPNQYAALRLLHKMLPAIAAFKLSAPALEWHFKNGAALGWLEWDALPFAAGQNPVALSRYTAFAKAVAYAKAFPPAENPLDLAQPVDFYTVVEMCLPAATTTRTAFLEAFALLTAIDAEELDALDAHLFPVFALANYQDLHNWDRVLEGAALLQKLSATVAQVVRYANPVLTEAEVADLRATLKSRYDEKTWLDTLKEIMDAIRPQKRDALVAYLLATNPGIKSKADLYEYFLVDVEMEACMPSSRIVQAHSSIQLFVQRCLMGLEPEVIANVDSDPSWSQWQWMKNYRVWEANRKVFLYPENWYDVTLTDDKTYLLTEFINEIQQNELTSDSAETALKSYLEKLDTIAFLEVMATWYDVANKDMHVFARTKGGDPATYYYRRFEKERYWSPWEKVELDITGNHLLAFKRNNRLHLAWPVFSEEAAPVQQSTIPNATPGTVVENETPKRKLKIQLAISEYSSKKWQPKKVSQDAIRTPDDYTNDASYFNTTKYSLLYMERTDQVILFSSGWKKQDYHYKNGAFKIAGCKGYPELAFEGDDNFPDFFPDFKNAQLASQRYNEITDISSDELAVRNVFSGGSFLELLSKTPGQFRISYPHQSTGIDLLGLLAQYVIRQLSQNRKEGNRTIPKMPLGTLLPYFEEDSGHAYVIIPGFYKKENVPGIKEGSFLTDAEKRTASDVFQLLEDIDNWVKKIGEEISKATPPLDATGLINLIITDGGFQKIMLELSKYDALHPVLKYLTGKIENKDFDTQVDQQGLVYGEQFKNLYHPLVCALRSTLYASGIGALMNRETQLQGTLLSETPPPETQLPDPSFNFKTYYKPNEQIVPQSFYKTKEGPLKPSYPIEDIDFSSDGSYSAYNWDLFFRLPLHIAGSLTQAQRFEEAMQWFHYMFNPTGALPGTGVQKYWVTKPFYLNQSADYESQRINDLLYAASDASNPAIAELNFAISEWRSKPFRPDVIARFRPVAYQKALLMKYLDNLTEWGDYLFRQDSMESVAQATQMYVLADKLLGANPRTVPPAVQAPYETYNQLERKLDSFGNALVALENILPDLSVLPQGGAELPPSVTLSMLYFCVPANEKMAEYRDRIADRLFKIRHCQNIEGTERSLALFAPPIDPALLVRAAAAGLNLSAVIGGLNAPTPYYRFQVLAQKATELAQEVRGLGSALLAALEKKDAEAMALLRSSLEIKVLNALKSVKELQILESTEQIAVLHRTQEVTAERHLFYQQIEKVNRDERLSLDKLKESHDFQKAAQGVKLAASIISLLPDINLGASGFGGSPLAAFKIGGLNLGQASNAASDILSFIAQLASNESARAAVKGGQERRFDDWKLQERLAKKELASIDQQIAAAEIRKELAATDLKNHELQTENAKKTDDFMRSKFTSSELYDWMIGQVSSVYFKAYKLAHDFAKKAERSYRFELGNDDSFISYGYWDSLKKGLQSADSLIHDIKRMEGTYLDKNRREFEITKHVSIAQLDPLALVRLRATGVCDIEIPEVIYDMDHPGQYFRRLKSVSVSLPCIAGPYTSVSAKLSLLSNRYRKSTAGDNAAGTGYTEDSGNDSRFVYNVGSIQSIATSNAQMDSGVFELNFRDERYLPFEGTGAIGRWRLELPTEVRQFNYDTISDVIIHVRYTAREGGSGLRNGANAVLKEALQTVKQSLSETGLHVALQMKQDLPNEWFLLKKAGTLDLTIHKSRLPYLVQSLDSAAIESVLFIAKVEGNPATFTLKVDGADTHLARVDELQLAKGANADIVLDTPFTLSLSQAASGKLEDLLLIVKYRF